MTRLEKLIEGIKPVVPTITAEDIVDLFADRCDNCVLNDYCDEYFYLKENGEYVIDEDGDKVVNMCCEEIVKKWLNENID